MTESLDLSDEETQFLIRAEQAGWVLVPVKATPDMVDAGRVRFWCDPEDYEDGLNGAVQAAWEDMLAAAPPLGRPMDDDE